MSWVTSFWQFVHMMYDKTVFPWCVIGSEDIGLCTHFAARVEISDSISTSSKVSFSLLEEIKKLSLPPKRLDIWFILLLIPYLYFYTILIKGLHFSCDQYLKSVLIVLTCRSACVHVGFADDADTSEARCIRSPSSVVKDFVSHLTWNSTPVLWKNSKCS